jgi:hypothetical protein
VLPFEGGLPVVLIADDDQGRRVAIGPRAEMMHLDEWPAGEEPGR